MEKGYWKKIFLAAAAYYAVISTFIFIVYLMGSNSIYDPAFSVVRMLFTLGFCVIFAIANSFLPLEKLNGFWKLIIHAGLTVGGFLALIYAPMVADGKHQSPEYTAPNVFVALGIVIVLYAIGYGIYFAISSKKAKKKNTKSEYKSLYRNKK